MKKGTKIVISIVAAVLVLGLAASVTVSALALNSVKTLTATVKGLRTDLKDMQEKNEALNNHETKENDVVIADEYTILATTQISDAYLKDDDSELSDRDKETLEMAKEVIDQVITDGMTDYEKEYAIYNWMCSNLGQDNNSWAAVGRSDGDNPHDVLKYKAAVCVGYATTFRLFMQMLEIDCKVVHNTEEYHSWDIVYIDDAWYHVDVYSGISGGIAYFNMNDAMLASSGQDWDTEFFPTADSLAYNPVYKDRVAIDSTEELLAKIVEAMKNQEQYIAVYMKDDKDVAAAATLLEYFEQMFWSQDNAVVGMPNYVNQTSIYGEDDELIFFVVFNNYMTDPDDPTNPDDPDQPDYPDYPADVDEEAIKKMLTDVFGPLGFNVDFNKDDMVYYEEY